MKLFTIGYEGISMDEFMSLLADNDIETIVDVREMPLSRKPGFSKRSLESALRLSGREYVHMAALGCPKPVRDRYREDGDWKRYTASFLKHLRLQDDAVAELAALATTSSCALLCYEADHNFCHRSMVADAVIGVEKFKIQHLNTADIRSRSCSVVMGLAFA